MNKLTDERIYAERDVVIKRLFAENKLLQDILYKLLKIELHPKLNWEGN
jgi:hypothetical protein